MRPELKQIVEAAVLEIEADLSDRHTIKHCIGAYTRNGALTRDQRRAWRKIIAKAVESADTKGYMSGMVA